MSIFELLDICKAQGIHLWVEGDRLKFRAPKGALTPQLKERIARQRDELISHLHHNPSAESDGCELAYGQRALWFQHQLAPLSAAYNLAFSARIVSEYDAGLLRAAVRQLVNRHPILRATYGTTQGQPRLFVRSFLEPLYAEHDASGLSEADLLAEVKSRNRDPFDLENGPIVRVHIFTRSAVDHILLLDVPHIACDGWSLGLLIRDLKTFCEELAGIPTAGYASVQCLYTDFIEDQRRMLSGREGARMKHYWTEQLAGEIPVLDLPLSQPRPSARAFDGATHNFPISGELYEKIKAFAKSESATLYTTLLSAFQILLMRYSAQKDVAVGAPVAGRDRAEYGQVIGLFMNQVVMRGDLSGNPTFRELLQRNRVVLRNALEYQAYPFPVLVQDIQPLRDPSCHPLFQVFFNMVKQSSLGSVDSLIDGTANDVPMDFGPFKLKPFSIPQQEGQFDLSLEMLYGDRVLISSFRYRTDIFAAETIERMGLRFERLLEAIVSEPEKRIWDLSYSRGAGVEHPGEPALPDPSVELATAWEGSVIDRVKRFAEMFPDRMAAGDDTDAWTYRELDDLSDHIAFRLIAGGIRTGDVVGVFAKRSVPLVVALLGVWKAGAAFVILDQSYPAEYLHSVFNTARPRTMIVIGESRLHESDHFEKILSSQRLLTLPLDKAQLRASLDPAARVSLPRAGSPDDIAYLAFTSGSSGSAKCIVGTHRPLSHFLAWHCHEFGFDAEDRFSMLSGLAHDPLLRDILTPFWVGATLRIPDSDTMNNPYRLWEWMDHSQITVSHLTPAMGTLIASGSDVKDRNRPSGLSHLRFLFFGGDLLSIEQVRLIAGIAPQAQLVNFYGATETPQAMAFYRIAKDTASRGNGANEVAVPIGKGIADVQLLLLNKYGRLAAVDELGEICIRTPYLSKGYRDDERLTAERFIVNPFTEQPGDRIYRTGDLGRYRANGNIVFCGRADRQLKVRGFRIEPVIIENCLKTHAKVHDAHVMLKSSGPGRDHLAAFVVLSLAQKVDSEALRRFVSEHLPAYMIPSEFVLIDAMPLTPNGKIDRRVLLQMESTYSSSEGEPAVPQSNDERLLADIWREVLQVQDIGIHDNFFQRGGHSLIATQVISRIRERLGLDLPLRVLFEAPTIADLARRIEIEKSKQRSVSTERIAPSLREPAMPLSYAQERLWFLQQLSPDSAVYIIGGASIIKGPLDTDKLHATFRILVQRHESLRTTFGATDGRPYQSIAAQLDPIFRVVDLELLPDDERKPAAFGQLEKIAREPFDLNRGPLLRVYVFRLAADHCILYLCMHHIISDGWSMRVLLKELTVLYEAFCKGSAPDLPALPVQYPDYAYWQRQYLAGRILEEHIAYWKKQLGGAPPMLNLPTDYPRPAIRSSRGAHKRITLPERLTQKLKALSQGEGSLFMLLLAALKTLLYRYSGQDDISIGTYIANRNREELEGLIGFFVNTLVLRTDLSGNPPFREVFQRVKDVAFGAFAHQDLPFEVLLNALNPERTMSHTPLFQVMLVMQNVPYENYQLSEISAIPIPFEKSRSDFDLTFWLWEQDNCLTGSIEYSLDLFQESTMERMSDHFQVLLQAIVEDPDQKIEQIKILPEAEARRLLEEWSGKGQAVVQASGAQQACVHRLFETQAAARPQAVALIADNRALTYEALNTRANRLARFLRKSGVGPETIVGLLMERSADLIIGLLAILKSGGAYLPLDSGLPPDRISYMVEDSNASLVLTTKKYASNLLTTASQTVVLEEHADAIANQSAEDLPAAARPDGLAYVIYTSGSTGKPKGVMIEHHSMINFIQAAISEYCIGPADRILQFAAINFDTSVEEIYPCLCAGGTLVLRDDAMLTSMAAFAEAVQRFGITVLDLPTVFWHELALSLDKGEISIPQCVRQVIIGGEKANIEALKRWRRHVDNSVRLLNTYGPTEATVVATVCDLSRQTHELDSELGVSIGRPLANVRCYVLDRYLQPVPIGIPGELHIGGSALARGYLNKPDLTKAAFMPDPFSGEPGRLYKTGDMVRLMGDGNLVFVGRSDNQVKIRGYRIEIGEIETCLEEHPQIDQAVVTDFVDKNGQKRLVAYIVPKHRQTPAFDEIREHLKKNLPDYMVPSIFEVLETLPLTANGKIDLKSLPVPGTGALGAERNITTPRNDTEAALIAIWKTILDVQEIDVFDNFFDIGGHSLLIARLTPRIKERLHVDISFRQFFETPTVAELAKVAEALIYLSEGHSRTSKRVDSSREEIAI